MKKIREIMPQMVNELKEVYNELALSYCERILEYVCNCTRNELYLSSERILDEEKIGKIKEIIRRCKQNEPFEYITGMVFFYNREFMVTPDVLIPRPDTEILVEEILKDEKENHLFFLELGTGSGIISSILTESNPDWVGIATDISLSAIKVAYKNRITSNMKLLCMDFLSAFKPLKQFDFIAGNLPYIKRKHIPLLDASVRDFEPFIALDGGEDGLWFFKRIALEGERYLKSGGRVYLEIGEDLKEDLEKIFTFTHWRDVRFIKDNASRFRVITASCKG